MTLHPRLDDLLELRHQAHTLGLASHHLVNSSFSGLYASVFRGSGLNFEDVREYREGDDIRNMEWNVTARTNVPHIKIFREERERSVVLCVDIGAHMSFGTRNTFKSIQAARATALLGWAANRLHDRVGGLVFGNRTTGPQYFRPSRGRRALWRLLHTLTEPTGNARSEPGCVINALQQVSRGTGTGSLIFLIADLNRDIDHRDFERVLGSLCQKHTVVVLPVDDPADRALPDMGRVTFTSPAGELVEIDTDDSAARAAYTEAWTERRTALENICNRLGIVLLPLSTEEEIHITLTQNLQHHARMKAV
ncbi:MAG TPA: DUF58 domain-containing protein [Chromatiales bacterium]|nr:DUF58 domain-containing protein [Chromatiales bacterium]